MGRSMFLCQRGIRALNADSPLGLGRRGRGRVNFEEHRLRV